MKSEESLRTLIQGKLVSCDACGVAIAKNQLVMECVGEHYPKTLQFHVRCFYIWDSERRTLGDEPACPSAPAE